MPVDDARIGDFSTSIVTPAPQGAGSPTAEAMRAAETRLETDAKKDEAALKPMTSYEERLKAIDMSREEAAKIVDAILLRGYFSKTYPLTKTLAVSFRTRCARDITRANSMLENQRFSYDHHYSQLFTRYMLAASLERLGSETFTHPQKGAKTDDIETAYRQRLSHIEDLPEPTTNLLISKLIAFDNMINVVMAEGVVENF